MEENTFKSEESGRVHEIENGKFSVKLNDGLLPEGPIRKTKIERSYFEVMNYVEKHNRTLKEEHELILQKKSQLSKSLRDFVEFMIEIEKHNPSPDPANPPIPNE